MPSGLRRAPAWGPPLLAAAVALGLAALAAAPAETYGDRLALIDHDDSVHRLTAGQIAAVRSGVTALAGLAGLAAALLATFRGRVGAGVERLGAEARRAGAELAALRPMRLWAFAGVFLVGLAVRLAWLDGPMRFDEADTFDYFASRSFFNILTDYTAPNNHILHTVAVRASYLVFGDAPWALRLPALLAGLLVPPLTYLFARRLFDEPAALLAMALAAVHPALVGYSANARGYSAVAVCTLVVFLAAALLRRAPNRVVWLGFTAAGAAGMFTIPVMLYPLATASLWALWGASRDRRRGLALEIAAAAAVIAGTSVLFYAPAAARTGIEAITANRYVAALPWPEWRAELGALPADLWRLWTAHLSIPVAAGLVAAAVAGLREREARRLAITVLMTAAAWMTVQRVVPFERVFLYAAPLSCVVVAAGLRRVRASRRPAAPVAVALLLGALYVGGRVWFPSPSERLHRELESLTPLLLAEAEGGAAVLGAIPLSEPIRYYLLTAGRPRGQTLAPDVVSGALPPLDSWSAVVVVRRLPDETPGFPGWRIDFEDPAFAHFSQTEMLQRGERIEVLRVSRAPDR